MMIVGTSFRCHTVQENGLDRCPEESDLVTVLGALIITMVKLKEQGLLAARQL